MSTPRRLFEIVPSLHDHGTDAELEGVATEIVALDPDGARIGRVIRETVDQLLDGQRTGRWDYRELRKTEKTHMGTLIEINLHREFEFDDGEKMDYRIAGIDVDCKFSSSVGGWQIPREALGHVCLLLWADDDLCIWSAGLLRVTEGVLRARGNRDRKRGVSSEGQASIRWLWKQSSLPENLLLHLDDATRSQILALRGPRNGQRRTDLLFRLVQSRLVSRTAVLTVGQQDDAPKRVRDSRKNLRSEGIIILGHQGDHPRIASALELPVPAKGEWVSATVAPQVSDVVCPAVSIAGELWRIAGKDDRPRLAPQVDARRRESV